MDENLIKRGDVLEVYVDGASRGNPGPAAWSYLFVNNRQTLFEKAGYIGHETNNTAEYRAIIEALKKAESFTRWKIMVFSDSNLAINQIKKVWRIKKEHLSKLCAEVYGLCQKFENVIFLYVGRENPFIKKADHLCDNCLKEQGFGKKDR